MSPPEPSTPKSLPKIRGTQIGLHTPPQVDKIKADMLGGRYAFHEERGRIYGVRDPNGTLYVKIGHHRLAAALEICRETGDASFVHKLVNLGEFALVASPPNDARPMPSRYWWGAFRNWLGF